MLITSDYCSHIYMYIVIQYIWRYMLARLGVHKDVSCPIEFESAGLIQAVQGLHTGVFRVRA